MRTGLAIVWAIAVVAAAAWVYWWTWQHSLKLSASYGRPRGMAIGFAIASVVFLSITLPYWAVRRVLLGRRA